MAQEINKLSNATNTALALSNLVLVTPQVDKGYQPQDKDGNILLVDAFLFNYEGDQQVRLSSDITDHYVEDNTSIQDQISLKPEEFNTVGYIGELTDFFENESVILKVLRQKLLVINAYTPELSASAQYAYNVAFQTYQVSQRVLSAYSINKWRSVNAENSEINVIGSNGLRDRGQNINKNQTKQQIAFQQLYGYWRDRVLFTVQTPWAIFKNMAIKDLVSIQSADTRMTTDFEITWKMIRFAKTTEDFNSINTIFNNQSAAEKNIGGGSTGAETSYLSKVFPGSF